jgi:hypothetical protein
MGGVSNRHAHPRILYRSLANRRHLGSMHRVLLLSIVFLALLCSGCSYATDYVIVNSSGAPVQVTYTIAATTLDPLATTGVGLPAMLPVSQLGGREWRKLVAGEFIFDRANRTVTVSLPSNQGLLITRGREYNPNPPVAEEFVIEEIRIAGPNGEMVFEGTP